MRTLFVSGKEPPPSELRDLVHRGSTSVDEISVADLSTFISREGFGVDRIVFWAGHSDLDVRSLALNYATAAGAERRQTILFVTPVPAEPTLDGMTRDELYIWPRDKDRLMLRFGASSA